MGTAETVATYVPRVVREWLDSPTPDARHQRIEGSMAFVDISGFTKLSERMARLGRMGAEGVTDVISECFNRLLADAYGFDGTLLKFGGDALLLFFRGEHHVDRAAAAALEMRRSLREIRVFHTEAGRVELGMTMGVHTGPFDFFLVGGSHRELVIAGPNASQLVGVEGGAHTGNIVVSPECAGLLPSVNVGAPRGEGRLLRGRVDAPPGDVRFYQVDADLEPFVPVGLRRSIQGQTSIESEHRMVTVAFLHFQGLDQRIESGQADGVAEDLEHLMRVVQHAADEREVCFLGSDIAPDGGKIILTAGAPRSSGNDEEAMLLALRSILDAEQPIPLRIGVNAGPVFAGEIGTRHRKNYTVMGDPVNLAARVMGKAAPGELLATASVLDRSRTLFDGRPLDPFTVKGKRHPVVATSVGEARGSRAGIATTELPLVGREKELDLLLDASESARRRRGRPAEIVAEPGSGKSRLLSEVLSRCSDFAVHRAGCRLYQADTPYFPVSQLLESIVGLDNVKAADRAVALESFVSGHAPDLMPWLSLVGIPLGIDVEPSDDVRLLDPEFRKSRLETVVADLLHRVLTNPTLLVIEDSHWMDDASADLLTALASRIGRQPWLLVLTRRAQGAPGPELDPSSPLRLELRPLDETSTAQLIRAATAGSPLPQHVVDTLVQRSDGNPLFLLELLAAVRAGETVESLPTSVEALITARIDRLPAGDRNVLRRTSVLGAGFSIDHSTAVLDTDRPRDAVGRLSDFLALDRSGWVSFRHALVRDVAYEGLPYRTRRRLHGRVADSILAADDAPSGENVALLSLHLFHAHRDAAAWSYSTDAGDRARSVFANLDAAAFYERALVAARRLGNVDARDRARVGEALGDVLDLAGQYDEARHAYTAARRLTQDDPIRQAEVILKEAYVAEHQGRYSNSVRCIGRALRLIDDRTDVDVDADGLRAKLVVWEAAVRAMQGRFAEAQKAAERGITESLAADDEATLARAYQIVDFARMSLGTSEGLENSYRALEIYGRLGDLSGEATAANNLGAHCFYEGAWQKAAELYGRARSARERVGDPVGGAACSMNLGELLLEQGDLDQADELLTEAEQTFRSAGDQWGVAFTSRLLGVTRVRAGDIETGRELVVSAREMFELIGSRAEALDTNISLGECLLFERRPEEAIAVLDAVLDDTGGGHEPHLPAAHRLRAFALSQMDDGPAGEAEVHTALDLARQLGAEHEVGLALDALTRFDAAANRQPAAEVLAERQAIFDRLALIRRVTPPLSRLPLAEAEARV